MSEFPRPTALIIAVAIDGRPRYQIAAASGINATTFSGILSGRIVASSEQRQRIAGALHADVADLFPEAATK